VVRAWAICVLLLTGSLLLAQKRPAFSYVFRETISSAQSKPFSLTRKDSVRILAIMVEFQKYNDSQTTGDGTFLVSGSSAQIDPPPHDSTYFKNKIRFVENYFRRVSNQKLTVTGVVYGQSKPITLTKPMRSYSPPTSTNDNRKLADLAIESWQIAHTLYPEIDFSEYDAFVIFHAGAGRDVDLVSSLGYNPTPYDIPSLYLDSAAFAAALGQSSFTGIVGNYIKNTIILPETESRDLPTSSGTTKLQLGINGMFAASVGSYLGLPDLFNTQNGRSGIGQFGLMDGADIFAYSGLFPPEPNAWEKIYLGWVTPIPIRSSTANIVLPAVGLSNEDTVYQIPISSSEYFLVENRNRNPKETGLDIKIADANGDTLWRHYNQDTSGFRYYDVSGINGSIVDVSNFDWALIGETDGTGKYDGGGILVWHIDEKIIQNGLKTNTVNADPDHRGVDLEEADGSKDIGQSYESLEAGSGTENGSPLDCWFDGNSAVIYKNIFDRSSFPNSNSHSGAASLVTINNFSLRSQRMSMSVEIGSNVLQRDSVFHHSFANVSTFPTSTKEHLYIPANDGLYAYKNDGTSLVINTSAILSSAVSDNGAAVYKLSSTTEIVASVQDSTLRIFRISLTNGQSSVDSIVFGSRLTTSPCIAYLDSVCILVGAESGSIYKLGINGGWILERSVGAESVASIALLPASSSSNPYEYYFTCGNRIYGEQDSVDLPVSSNKWILAAAVSPKGNYIVAAEKNGSKVISFSQSLLQKNFEISTTSSAIQEAAIADIDGDGEKDILIQSAANLSAFNRIGSLLDGFPLSAKTGCEFTGTPLIVDFNGDTKPEIILLTNDGEMWVYDGSGKLLSGFPVQVTSQGKAFPAIYTRSSDTLGIAILSENGSLDAFILNTSVIAKTFYWWQHLGDERHLNADTSLTILKPLSTEFMPKSRVYNWPNPVYSHSTQIRYYTSEDANITITILDLSGMKIAELKGRGAAGMDNEVTWDVSHIQSGIYLARVEARGANKNEVAIIKIAVVK
jgi:hypothetical protein